MTEWGQCWESTAIQYEDQPDDLTRADWFYRGFGRVWSQPEYPQRQATDEQADGMERGWQALLAKAQRDIETIDEDTRLAAYVASHRPGQQTLATIKGFMRKRYHEQKVRIDRDRSGDRSHGDTGRSREGANQPHTS